MLKKARGAEGPPPGGSKWIGTAAPRPTARRLNPAGVRIGQKANRNGRPSRCGTSASTRTRRHVDSHPKHQIALRRCASSPARGPDELDLDGTIKGPRTRALDIHCGRAAQHLKVLMVSTSALHTGTSRLRRAVFARAPSFKHLEYFYFHNCLYGSCEDNGRRWRRTPTWQVRTSIRPTTRWCLGDASMSLRNLGARGSVDI